jgi:hypothetical protein
MKLSSTLLFSVLLVGCGGDTTTGNDGGTDGSSNDATTGDASNDATITDAPTDAPGKDAGPKLDAGAACDLQADNCGPGLKCCTGGAVQVDGGVGHCVVPTDAGTCPLVP